MLPQTALAVADANDPHAALKAAFANVDQYQPVYRLEDAFRDRPVSRTCTDRCILLDRELAPDIPNLRILDVGCSMGYLSLYFAERGAVVHGIDMRPENVVFCSELAKVHAIPARFTVDAFTPDFCAALPEGRYDVVFLFSVLHHVITQHGLPAVQAMMATLLDRTDMLFVELARPSEDVPFGWKEHIPANELDIFASAGEIEIEHLGDFPALGAITVRPLYRVRRTRKAFNGVPHRPLDVRRSAIRTGETRNRKYYLSDTLFTKCFVFDGPRIETYSRFLAEEAAYRRIGRKPGFLPLIGSEIRGRLGLLTLPRIEGVWLQDAIRAGEARDIRQIALSVLDILGSFADAGLYWNDFRTHNLMLSREGVTALDFECAGPVETEHTLNLFLWFLHDLQSGRAMTQEVNVFRDGNMNVPRPPLDAKDYAEPLRDLAEAALQADGIRAFIARAADIRQQ